MCPTFEQTFKETYSDVETKAELIKTLHALLHLLVRHLNNGLMDNTVRVRRQHCDTIHTSCVDLQSNGYGAVFGNIHLLCVKKYELVVERLIDLDILHRRWLFSKQSSNEYLHRIEEELEHPNISPLLLESVQSFFASLRLSHKGLQTDTLGANPESLLKQLAVETECAQLPVATRRLAPMNVVEEQITLPPNWSFDCVQNDWSALDKEKHLFRWNSKGILVEETFIPIPGSIVKRSIRCNHIVAITDSDVWIQSPKEAWTFPKEHTELSAEVRHVEPLGEDCWLAVEDSQWFVLKQSKTRVRHKGTVKFLSAWQNILILQDQDSLEIHVVSSTTHRRFSCSEPLTPTALSTDGLVLATHTKAGWVFYPLDGGSILQTGFGAQDQKIQIYRDVDRRPSREISNIAHGYQGRWIFSCSSENQGVAWAIYENGIWEYGRLRDLHASLSETMFLRHAAVTRDAFWCTLRTGNQVYTIAFSREKVKGIHPMYLPISFVKFIDENWVVLGSSDGYRALGSWKGWYQLTTDYLRPLLCLSNPKSIAMLHRASNVAHLIQTKHLNKKQIRPWANGPIQLNVQCQANALMWFFHKEQLQLKRQHWIIPWGTRQRNQPIHWLVETMNYRGDVLFYFRNRCHWLLEYENIVFEIQTPHCIASGVTGLGPSLVTPTEECGYSLITINTNGRIVFKKQVAQAWSVRPNHHNDYNSLFFLDINERILHWWHQNGEVAWSITEVMNAEHTFVNETSHGLVMWAKDPDFGAAYFFPKSGDSPSKIYNHRVYNCVPIGSGFLLLTKTRLLFFGENGEHQNTIIGNRVHAFRSGEHIWVGWDGWGRLWRNGVPEPAIWCGIERSPQKIVTKDTDWMVSWENNEQQYMTVGTREILPKEASFVHKEKRTIQIREPRIPRMPQKTTRSVDKDPERSNKKFQAKVKRLFRRPLPLEEGHIFFPASCISQLLLLLKIPFQTLSFAVQDESTFESLKERLKGIEGMQLQAEKTDFYCFQTTYGATFQFFYGETLEVISHLNNQNQTITAAACFYGGDSMDECSNHLMWSNALAKIVGDSFMLFTDLDPRLVCTTRKKKHPSSMALLPHRTLKSRYTRTSMQYTVSLSCVAVYDKKTKTILQQAQWNGGIVPNWFQTLRSISNGTWIAQYEGHKKKR